MRYEKFVLHDNSGLRYSSRTIGAIKKFIKKHNIDTHGEDTCVHLFQYYNDFIHAKRVQLSEFMNNTGDKNSPIKQKEFSRDYRHSRYVNAGLKE